VKTIGIVGGIGPESTIVYYRQIITSYRQQNQGKDYPKILINSINLTKMLSYLEANQLDEVTAYLAGEINRLTEAGADFAVLASNTPHIVFEAVQASSSIPLISIVNATCNQAKVLGLRKIGLFGTKFTMQNNFYANIFAQANIDLVTPNNADQTYIHQVYMTELVQGIILNETKHNLLTIINQMKQVHQLEGLILGGTELPLILKADDTPDMPLLDTTQIHVKAIVDYVFT